MLRTSLTASLIASTLVLADLRSAHADDGAKKSDKQEATDPLAGKSPAQLLKYMQDSLNIEGAINSKEEEVAAMRKAFDKILVAADRLLSLPAATEEERTEAYQFKINILGQGIGHDVPGFGERLKALGEELYKKDPKGDITKLACYFYIKSQFASPYGLSGKAIPAVEDFMKKFPGDDSGAVMLGQIGEGSMLADELADSKKAYEILIAQYPGTAFADGAAGPLARINAVGKPIEWSGTTLDGKTVSSQTLKGKVVLIDFWATWCGPCVAEMPRLKELYEKHHGKGFEIVGVSLDDEPDAVGEFVKESALPWPQIYSADKKEREFDHPLVKRYGIQAIPTMFLIDAAGNVVSTTLYGERLEEEVSKLMRSPVGTSPAAQ